MNDCAFLLGLAPSRMTQYRPILWRSFFLEADTSSCQKMLSFTDPKGSLLCLHKPGIGQYPVRV